MIIRNKFKLQKLMCSESFLKVRGTFFGESQLIDFLCRKFVMRCAIWYHLKYVKKYENMNNVKNNMKNVKNTHRGVLLLVKLKVAFLHGCFSRF